MLVGVERGRWLKADLHIHSIYSEDSSLTIEQIITTCRRQSFDIISITDHNTFEGALKASSYAKNYNDITILIGIEIMTNLGELIVIGDGPFDVSYDAYELIDIAHSMGYLVIAPHPYDIWRKGVRDHIYNLNIDAIEVYNTSSSGKAVEKALNVAKALSKPAIGSSDAHTVRELNTSYTVIHSIDNVINVKTIIDSIKTGKVKPYFRSVSRIFSRLFR
ncbi:MAG: PHP domain-containing protein [Candidatus Methanomethylicia archaeon]